MIPREAGIRTGAIAMAAAGGLWCVKAASILATGNQPAYAFELGQLLFPVGVLGVFLTLEAPTTGAKLGAVLAAVGIVGTVLAMVYPLLPGARVSTSEDFVLPYSLFVLTGALGAFFGLWFVGTAVWRTADPGRRWRRQPLVVAVAPIPLMLTAIADIELPILGIGAAWLWLGHGLWTERA